jgi:tRNA pseudouridine38-40 synthase
MDESKNIRMALRYDGTNYRGWQSQAGAGTIQDILEEKIRLMTGAAVRVIAAGRTDAGVHALHQICHFRTPSNLNPESLRRGLNSLLPPDIFVSAAEYAPPDFHARYSAKNKAYEYRILNRPDPDPFLRLYTWHIPSALDLREMEKCLPPLLGEHDFSSFMSSGSRVRSPVRRMMRAEMGSPAEGLLYFEFQADGFLRHMVRNVVGTLVEVGKGRWNSDGFQEIFQARDRCEAGIKAPAQGLFLRSVFYEDDRDFGLEVDSARASRTEA